MKKLLLTTLGLLCLTGMNAQCWTNISIISDRSLAIKDDGTLWAWGANLGGENGPDGAHMYEPTQVGSDTDWKSVHAGLGHGVGMKTDGTLWSWGANNYGQLGTDAIGEDLPPTQINNDTDWKSIKVGWWHNVAIKNDGTLWYWGLNSFDTETPGSIMEPTQLGTDNNWASISAGMSVTLATKTDGTLWIWGTNFETSEVFPFPTQIGTDTDWAVAKTGMYNMAAIKTDGTLWIGGNGGAFEQVGADNWLSVGCPVGVFVGIKSDGTLWSWGENVSGQLGNGDGPAVVDEPAIISEDTNWEYLIAGDTHIYAMKSDGSIWGWGDNLFGALALPQGVTMQNSPFEAGDVCATAGIDDIVISQSAIYPNPVSNMLYIDNNDYTIQALTITDITGKTVVTQTGHTNQIDVQQLPAGIYFIEIKTDPGTSHQKFIKE